MTAPALFSAPERRLDGDDKTTGATKYTGDIAFPGALESAFVRSPYPQARIRSVDTAGARALAGVRAERDDPEAFLTRIGELLRTVAEEATAQYEAAVNPMPAPHSQRPPGELSAIDPRLLSGLSLPMLTRRIVKRS